jgi:hypothetical protein
MPMKALRRKVSHQRASEDGNRGGEDELDRLLGSSVPSLLEQEPDGIDIDLHSKVKVVLGSSGHDTVKAVDSGGGAELCAKERLDGVELREVGLDSLAFRGVSDWGGLD